MNFETYTERARSVIQSAQTAALAAGHQLFQPEHILKTMLEDRDRLAVNLIRAAGGNPEIVQQKTEEALRAQPSVSGGDTGLRLDQKTAKLFADADAGAGADGDADDGARYGRGRRCGVRVAVRRALTRLPRRELRASALIRGWRGSGPGPRRARR